MIELGEEVNVVDVSPLHEVLNKAYVLEFTFELRCVLIVIKCGNYLQVGGRLDDIPPEPYGLLQRAADE
ncbi:hypothetical protein DSO57_1012005 [Entomophthora muscae]|uniref:Uncharacterized protein n=1 Tax=Entomophthora muscae TaxID=34485 RepID=A0ACC2UFU0_9FUNG|nr:hypothetical protein DSO57_1012005 [Entomophthora muscae]